MTLAKVFFYGALARRLNEKSVEIDASTLKRAFDKLMEIYGEDFENLVFTAPGKLNRFINFYVNGKDIRYLNNINTPLKEGDTVSIMPAVSGG